MSSLSLAVTLPIGSSECRICEGYSTRSSFAFCHGWGLRRRRRKSIVLLDLREVRIGEMRINWYIARHSLSKEVLMWRSVAMLPHAPTRDDTYRGYLIPANIWAIHRHPREFPNPDEFKPSRPSKKTGFRIPTNDTILLASVDGNAVDNPLPNRGSSPQCVAWSGRLI